MELEGRERRRFLQRISGSILLATAGGESLRPFAGEASMHWPKLIGTPVLDSLLHPVRCACFATIGTVLTGDAHLATNAGCAPSAGCVALGG
jgi:hypothetical protein